MFGFRDMEEGMNGETLSAAEAGAGRLRVLAVTAEPLLAFGIERLLEGVPDIAIATAGELGAALAVARQLGADLLLLDPASSTPEELCLIRRDLPLIPIALWAHSFSDEFAFYARECGVAGFLPRTASNHELVETIRKLGRGGVSLPPAEARREAQMSAIRLSRRQTEIIGLLAQGMTNREVAAALGLTEGTVKSYMIQLLRKTGARDRFELALLGLKSSWPGGEAAWGGETNGASQR
jgi:DNA-binding NarL/FixJ family response regulator